MPDHSSNKRFSKAVFVSSDAVGAIICKGSASSLKSTVKAFIHPMHDAGIVRLQGFTNSEMAQGLQGLEH